MRLLGQAVVFLAMASWAFGGANVPEVDGSTAGSAIALVSGGLLILRGRRKK